jgi:hypothetical protein
VNNGSQNPIAYCELAAEAQFRLRQCACSCGETSERDFLPGHEIRAIQAHLSAHFGGSPLRSIRGSTPRPMPLDRESEEQPGMPGNWSTGELG